MKGLKATVLIIRAFFIWVGLISTLASLASAQTLNDPNLRAEQVVQGLSLPTNMAFIGLDDILVLQKNDGRVRRVVGGVLQPDQVLDVAVDNSSERGLLGIAVHPRFPSTPSVYLYYTESSTGNDTSGFPTPLGNRVYRYTWNGSALINPTLILHLPVTPGANHNGGIITFGPDGKLYVIIGDLNRNGQLQNFPVGRLPDDTSVILRLNDNGTVPSDNPFFAQGGNLAKYYAYGIRNSFGMSFDPVTGKLWDTENGPDTYDEINLVEPGFNSGWEKIMGPDARDPQGINDLFHVPGSAYSDPEFSWFDTVAPTGILFLNSARLGEKYQNDLFVGDNNNGNVYHFELNATRDGFDFASPDLADLVADTRAELDELIFGTGFGVITDLKIGPEGLLYVLSLSLGKIFRISSRAGFIMIDAKANGSDGPLQITHGQSVIVTVALEPGDGNGLNADWWVAAETPFGLYWYTVDRGWVRSDPPIRVHGGPLFKLSPVEVLNTTGLPVGTYTFYFAVDLRRNGVLDFDQLHFDSVEVRVIP